jgi:hypothetical protein
MATTAPIQTTLLAPERPDSLPTDGGHYVAVLQSKSGERDALRHASESTWDRLTPVVEIVGPKTPKVPLPRTSVAAWIKRVADVVGAHPCYLDFLRLDPTLRVQRRSGETEEPPVLAVMYAEARKRRMCSIPVVHVGESTPAHLALVADAVLEDNRGVALRYRVRRVVPPAGAGHRGMLQAALDVVSCACEDADLLVDLEYLDEDVEVEASDLVQILREMCAVGEWRSLVVIATSMPKMMSAVKEGTLGSIPRREWELWSELAHAGLERMPAFGDYAVQHPDPPLDDVGANTVRANVRYTAAAETLVARGRGPVSQEGKEQYHDLCAQLVAHTEFQAPSYSWGDQVIADCAKGMRGPGSQAQWRGAGTSHHLRFVTDQVRQSATELGSDASGSELPPDLV